MAKTTHYYVTNRYDAWKKANELFPTDYEIDALKTYRAGYDIYVSTCEDNYSYICDLCSSLELNLDDNSTIRINIIPGEKPELLQKLINHLNFIKSNENLSVMRKRDQGYGFSQGLILAYPQYFDDISDICQRFIMSLPPYNKEF